MDIWLLLCMLFVGSAIFEYAVMLAIRFGKQKKNLIEKGDKENREELCNKVDGISLWLFMGIYVVAVGFYFYTVATHSWFLLLCISITLMMVIPQLKRRQLA